MTLAFGQVEETLWSDSTSFVERHMSSSFNWLDRRFIRAVYGYVGYSSKFREVVSPSAFLEIGPTSFRFRWVSRFARYDSRFARVGGLLPSGGRMNKSRDCSLSSVGSHPRLGSIAPSRLEIKNTTLVEPAAQGAENRIYPRSSQE